MNHTNLEYDLYMPSATDLSELMAIYENAKSRPFCVWNETYPSENDIKKDIEEGELYTFKTKDGQIIAAIARDRDPNVDVLSFWDDNLKPAAEIARVVVKEGFEGNGLAAKLIKSVLPILRERGFKGVHYLVAKENILAVKAYAPLCFLEKGNVFLYNEDYTGYELKL